MNLSSIHSAGRPSFLLLLALAAGTGCGGGSSYKSAQQPGSEPYYAHPSVLPKQAHPISPATPAMPALSPMGGTAAQSDIAFATRAPEPVGTEGFKDYGVNPFVETNEDRFSTFSIDVDTASYSLARRKLFRENILPAYQSVRAEEFLNSFDYEYEPPGSNDGRTPFRVHFAASPSPLTPGHHFLRIGIQAKRVTAQERQPVHLVYLVDVSGSMASADRLPLAKRSLQILTNTLKPGDTVALCTYAGSTRVVLEPTGVDQKAKILAAVDDLSSGGGTAMSSGIQLAYDLATKTLVKGHLNRVVVLSDGDANIGNSSHEAILETIRQYKNKGITLSTVGFGSGNYQDVMMEQLADKGDGNYTYIDSEEQARKVFGEQVDGLLQVVARDVKIQVELNPTIVKRYRLIGYENRDVKDKDFRADKVDAGEVGAGHSVTALYDVELVEGTQPKSLKSPPVTLRLRHKPAKNTAHGGGDVATEAAFPMPAAAFSTSFDKAPDNFRFAVSVAAFAEVLRKSPHAAEWKLQDIERFANQAAFGKKDRLELVSLVQKTQSLSGSTKNLGMAAAKD